MKEGELILTNEVEYESGGSGWLWWWLLTVGDNIVSELALWLASEVQVNKNFSDIWFST